MPHPSRHSQSALARSEPDEYLNKDDTIITENTEKAINATSEENDWFFGTEELLDALPKVWTRSLLYVLIAFAAIILPWAMLSKVDETGSARGRIEPKGATQKLDSPVGGGVTVVRVKEGETVKSGQVLLELESDVLRTELQPDSDKARRATESARVLRGTQKSIDAWCEYSAATKPGSTIGKTVSSTAGATESGCSQSCL
jgi:HlyD family secretion protein